ncbi:hypothetical protein IMY05_007G0069700 [Salix suchowensis]|nr:hypothetical protein IMY05_007G0069700 [Salix suchowensis]
MDDDLREVRDDRSKGFSQKHSQRPPKSFRSRLESFCRGFPSLDSLIQLCDYFAN